MRNNKINYQDLYREKRYRVFLPNDKMILSLPDKHKYIIGIIYYKKLFDRTLIEFVPLYSKILKFVLGQYHNVINDLIEYGIIEIDNSYIVSNELQCGKSKGYKLTSDYQSKKVVSDFIKNDKIVNRIIDHKNGMPCNLKRHHKLLFRNLNKLDIEHKKAIEFINAEYYETITKVKTERQKESVIDKYNAGYMSIDYIHRKDFRFIIDPTAGRIHNNITNLSRDLRQFLNFRGQKLKNIDLKNSQPVILNILIEDYIRKETQGGINPPYVSPINNLDCKNKDLSDVELYKKLTCSGQFYDYLMKIAGISNRDKFKKDLFSKFFYCDLNKPYSIEYKKIFEAKFPTIARIIDNYKKDDYKQLAIKLQRAEANIMIEKIIKRIYNERKDIFVLTIHDSILTTDENVEYVKEIIFDEFERNFNLKPSIKIE